MIIFRQSNFKHELTTTKPDRQMGILNDTSSYKPMVANVMKGGEERVQSHLLSFIGPSLGTPLTAVTSS
jgi:hypothetical protein